jgi:hypothetical protein
MPLEDPVFVRSGRVVIGQGADRLRRGAAPIPAGTRGLAALLASILAALCLGLGSPAACGEADDPTTEFRVKAACLFKFTPFIEWPEAAFPDPKAPFIVAILGKDPFGPILEETFKGKSVGNHPIELRRYKDLKELKPCHMLYVSESEKENLEAVAKATKDMGAVTASDIETFTRKAGAIRFLIAENKVRFEINLDAAKRAKVTISSKLLKIAVKVVRDEGGGE